jgi:hypothetical protein
MERAVLLPPGAEVTCPATDAFPLKHSFVFHQERLVDADPVVEWIRVRMDRFLRFLETDDRVRFCPIFAPRTKPNSRLQPIADYITVFSDVATQAIPRKYKYAEGLANVQLTAKGDAHMEGHMTVVEVSRQCQCSAVKWHERVCVNDIRDRMVQVRSIRL